MGSLGNDATIPGGSKSPTCDGCPAHICGRLTVLPTQDGEVVMWWYRMRRMDSIIQCKRVSALQIYNWPFSSWAVVGVSFSFPPLNHFLLGNQFTDEQYTTINQSTAGRFYLQLIDYCNSGVLLISEFPYYINITMSLYSIIEGLAGRYLKASTVSFPPSYIVCFISPCYVRRYGVHKASSLAVTV